MFVLEHIYLIAMILFEILCWREHSVCVRKHISYSYVFLKFYVARNTVFVLEHIYLISMFF